MQTMQILAGTGTIGTGEAFLLLNEFSLPIKGKFWPEQVNKNQVMDIAVATEASVKTIGGTLGWGMVGGVLLGPVGLLAGLLLGGKQNKTVFTLTLRDGRSLLASCDTGTFIAIKAATF